jgi:Zn-dependent peptidase ImmA (M78 family)
MKISHHATQFLKDLELYNVPVNPIELCEKLDIVYQEQPYQGFDGTLIVAGSQQMIGVSSNIIDLARKRYTCAHELGHSYYDADTLTTFMCTRNDMGYGNEVSIEREIRANRFASEILMPAPFFASDISRQQPSWEIIQNLSTKYQTSLQATATRFVQLSSNTCWLVIVKNGQIKRYVKNDLCEFKINLNNSVKLRSIKTNGWLVADANEWLFDHYRVRDKILYYWPLAENQFGEILVLVWDKGDSLLHDDYARDYNEDEERSWKDESLNRF